jgi:hypothetical protein
VQKLCDCNSHPDNIRWGDDGCLYIVSQIFSEDPWTEYEKRKAVICDVGFAVVQLNPEGWTAKELLRCDGFKGAFGAGTTALKIGNELWIGTFWGDRVAIFKLGKSPRTFPF